MPAMKCDGAHEVRQEVEFVVFNGISLPTHLCADCAEPLLRAGRIPVYRMVRPLAIVDDDNE